MTRLGLAVILAAVTACASTSEGTVLVSAASSLTDVFAEIEEAFEASHPDIDVRLNFASSSLLAEQVVSGAPVDVFAPADVLHMDRVEMEGMIDGSAAVFAANSLQLAVPRGNPAGVSGLDDLEDETLFVGLCDEPVPCGRLARETLGNAGVAASVDSNEPNVRSLLTKIGAGELDVGIVYVTDVAAAGNQVDGIEIHEGVNVTASYPIGVIKDGANPANATLFVEFVLSPEGRAILASHGFRTP